MKILSLFANVGIAETYLHNLGFQLVIANELDEKRSHFLKFQYPTTKVIAGDIRSEKVKTSIIKQSKEIGIDIIMATPPCQGMSTVGKMDPFDQRNHLIADTVELILKIKPKYVFLENVPEQLRTKILYNGKLILIPEFIKLLLSKNYYFSKDWIVNTKDYSVPQSRERSIFLLSRKDQTYIWEMPPKDRKIITLRDAIGDLPSLDPFVIDISIEKQLKMFPDYYNKKAIGLEISPFYRALGHVYRQVYAMMHTPSGKTAFDNPSIYKPKKKDGSFVRGFKNTYKRMSWDSPSNTITTYNRTIGSQENVHPGRLIGKTKGGIDIYSDARVLTLYEILILFSMPKNWKIPDWASENFVRTVIGEGIPPLFVKKVFSSLKKGYG